MGFIGTILVLLVLVSAVGLGGTLLFSEVGHADDSATLAGNHPREAETFRQLGEANPALHLPMEIRFVLRNQKGLETLLAQLQTPKSPNYHKWLTRDEFVKRFGPSAEQVKAVSDWLASEGFIVTKSSANGIEFTGAAAQAQRTFAVRIAKFGDGSVYANTSDPVIPKRFAGVIGAIRGMDNMIHAVATARIAVPQPRARFSSRWPSARASSEVIGNPRLGGGGRGRHSARPTCATFMTRPWVPGADGTGSCIDIIDDSDFLDSTATAVRCTIWVADGQLHANDLEGSNPGLTADQDESELDVQWAHVAAPGASI